MGGNGQLRHQTCLPVKTPARAGHGDVAAHLAVGTQMQMMPRSKRKKPDREEAPGKPGAKDVLEELGLANASGLLPVCRAAMIPP